jgi:aspartyl-tRNA(Asn)/glutamyl-tRNA(Gln) amidotransferase subunit A
VEDYTGGPVGDLEGWRIGVIREAVDREGEVHEALDRHGGGELPGAVRRNWLESLARLEDLGAEIVEVSVPNVGAAIATYYVIASCEASANLARFDGARYGRRAAEAGDLLSLYLDSRSGGFGAEVQRRILLGTFALASGYYEAYYGRAQGVLGGLRRQLAAAFEEVDLLVTPTSPGGAFRLGERVDDPLAMYLSDVFTTPASLAGLPAVAVPSGRDGEGLPLSLQILGRPFEEARVLRAAAAFEAAVGWRVEPAVGT